MKNRKLTLVAVILCSLSIHWPALAQSEHHKLPLSERITAHVPKRTQKYANFRATSESVIAMMRGVHMATERVIKTRDLNLALGAARLLSRAQRIQHAHMVAMTKMRDHLQQHINEHNSGKAKLSVEALQIMKEELQGLSEHMANHKAYCHQYVKPQTKQVMQFLFSFANQQIQGSYPNLTRQLKAAELLEQIQQIKTVMRQHGKGKHGKSKH